MKKDERYCGFPVVKICAFFPIFGYWNPAAKLLYMHMGKILLQNKLLLCMYMITSMLNFEKSWAADR